MHLAVDAQQGAIRVNDGCGVMVQPEGALFEQRGNNDDAKFLSQCAQARGGGSGDGFGKIEQPGIFFTAEVL